MSKKVIKLFFFKSKNDLFSALLDLFFFRITDSFNKLNNSKYLITTIQFVAVELGKLWGFITSQIQGQYDTIKSVSQFIIIIEKCWAQLCDLNMVCKNETKFSLELYTRCKTTLATVHKLLAQRSNIMVDELMFYETKNVKRI